jgi:O-antigen ligase
MSPRKFDEHVLPILYLLALCVAEYANELTWVLYVPAVVLAVVFLAQMRTGTAHRLDVRLPEIGVSGLALLALPLISLFFSPDPYISLIEALGYVLLFALLMVTSSKPVETLTWGPLVVGIAMLPYVVQGIPQAFVENVNAHGGMHDSNLYAGYLTAGAAALVAVCFSKQFSNRQVLVGVTGLAAAVLVVGAYVGHSRGAWLALIVSTGLTLTVTKNQTQISAKKIALILVALGAVSLVCTTPKTERDIAQHDHYGQSTNSRLAMWDSTLRMIHDHPVKGVGFGLWHIAYPQYRTSADTDSAGYHAHNDYLEAFASGGIVGGTAVLCIPALWLYGLFLSRKVKIEDPWAFVGYGVAAGVLVLQAVVNFIYHDLSPSIVIGFSIGAMFAHTRQGRVTLKPRSIRNVAWAALTLIMTAWALLTYLAMVPTLILGAPHGDEARYFGKVMTPRALLFLAKANPLASAPYFTLGQESMLEGLKQSRGPEKAKDFKEAIRYFSLAETRQGVQAGTAYKRAMVTLLAPDMDEASRKQQALEILQTSLDKNPGYWPSVNAYVRLSAVQKKHEWALRVLTRAINAVPLYQRKNFITLRSELLSGRLDKQKFE